MPVFPAIFERVAGNLLSVDHSTRVPPFNFTSCVTAQQSVVMIFEKLRKNVKGGSCSG